MRQDLLLAVVQSIVATASPEKIVWFPSSSADADAELKVLVVASEPFGVDRRRRDELARLQHAVAGIPAHVEVFLYSLDELDKWREQIRQVLTGFPEGGRLLYAKAPASREDDACETAAASA